MEARPIRSRESQATRLKKQTPKISAEKTLVNLDSPRSSLRRSSASASSTSWPGSPWSGWASPPSPTRPRWRERADGAAEMSGLVPGRVVVCGAGVIGAAVAYFLSRRGIAVTVIERTGVACAASGKSGGFIALDWCDNSELGPLARVSFALHARLAEEITTDYGYRRMDTYMVAAREHGTV